jgi:hypothetical protein
VKIGHVASAVAGSAQFTSQPGLPLQQNHLDTGIFRRSQSRSHARSTAAYDSNNHIRTSHWNI